MPPQLKQNNNDLIAPARTEVDNENSFGELLEEVGNGALGAGKWALDEFLLNDVKTAFGKNVPTGDRLIAMGSFLPIGRVVKVVKLAEIKKVKEAVGRARGNAEPTNKTQNKVTYKESNMGSFAGKIDARSIPSMTKEEIVKSLPKEWSVMENNGFVHIKDIKGNIRMRIDPPDKQTVYDHVHIYDEKGNPLDTNMNIVDRKSLSAHIPYKK